MLVELFIIYQLIVIGLFFISFFTKHEIIWALTAIFSGILMYTSYHIEYYTYVFNTTTSAYATVSVANSYPYLMGINMVFLILSLVLGLYDLFDKYGSSLTKKF